MTRILLQYIRDRSLPPSPSACWRTEPEVLASFCTTASGQIIMDGRPPITAPPPANPYVFSREDYWKQGAQSGVLGHMGVATVHDLFVVAEEYRSKNKPDLVRALCDAHFVTDSTTMVQLFNVARAACHRVSKEMPEPQLNLVAQNINGRIYMRAFNPPGGDGEVRKEATGQPVPPRYQFCGTLQTMGAQSFKRLTTYTLNRAPVGEHAPHNIVIHDDQLVNPTLQTTSHRCSDERVCNVEGCVDRHAVPVVITHDAWNGQYAVWARKLPTDILPRTYFAGCGRAVLNLHSEAAFRAFGAPRPVAPVEQVQWASRNNRELWCLASLLDQIQAEAAACFSADGHVQLRMRLERASATNSCGASSRDKAADYELVSEVLVTGERLISAGNALTLCNWINAANTPPPTDLTTP